MDQTESSKPAPDARFDALVRSLLPTFGRTGRDALLAMIEQLGSTLHARRAHVSVPVPGRPGWFQMLARWPRSEESSHVFELAGTASADVWARGEIIHWGKLAEAFPARREAFERWRIDSLVGLRLDEADSRPLGVLVVGFGGERAPDRELAVTLIRLFSVRAVGELLRLQAEEERFAAERLRLEAEAALAAQEKQFADVFEHTEDSVFIVRVEAPDRFVYERVNRRMAEIVGRKQEEFAGRSPDDFFPPKAAAQMRADSLACLSAGEPISHEREFVLPAGTRSSRITLIPSRDPAGNIVRIVGLATDITALRQQQRLFSESELIARIGGWEFECSTNRLLWTPGTFGIFECDPARFTPTLDAAIQLYTEECRPGIRHTIERVLRDGGDFEFLATARLASGRLIHVRALGQAVGVDGRVARLLGGVQDVTEQEEAHEQRLRLEAQLRRAQKMEAVGTLAGGIAHDFNNILAGIMGNTQLAMLDLGDGVPSRRFLDNAYQGCLRARDLVRRILTFSRQAEQPRAVALLRPIVEEALELLRASLPSSVAIVTRFSDEQLHVLADPGQIHQILLNLGANAAQAMRPAGGSLTIELAASPAQDDWHRGHPQVRAEHRVRLSVRDTGHGIPSGLLDRIFEPFFTTKPVGEGSGLGLAMVHGIVENHGGAIVVESVVGQGSAFHIFLPGQVRSRGDLLAADEGPVLVGGGRTVLVVDDEPAIVELATPMLKHLGYQPKVFNDPHAALAAFAAAPAAYTALLCDLTMPGVDGVTLARSVRAYRPDLPVVIMTGYLRPADLAPMRESGLRHHLAKPFSVENLSAVLGAAIAAGAGPGA